MTRWGSDRHVLFLISQVVVCQAQLLLRSLNVLTILVCKQVPGKLSLAIPSLQWVLAEACEIKDTSCDTLTVISQQCTDVWLRAADMKVTCCGLCFYLSFSACVSVCWCSVWHAAGWHITTGHTGRCQFLSTGGARHCLPGCIDLSAVFCVCVIVCVCVS